MSTTRASVKLICLVADGLSYELAHATVCEQFNLTHEQAKEITLEYDADTRRIAATDWEGDDYVAQEFRMLTQGQVPA
jgi:hypothetical protein